MKDIGRVIFQEITMEPKSSKSIGGDPTAFLIQAADFSRILERIERMAVDLTEIKDALPLKRRKLSKSTRHAHISCILSRFEGKCPCCREVRIIDENGRPLPACNEEHYINRHENALDKTWLLCQECNQRKTSGKVAHADVEALFKAYQVTLRKHISEAAGPYQMRLADSERLCSFRSRPKQ